MAALTYGWSSYGVGYPGANVYGATGGAGMREDVADVITLIDPDEVPTVAILEKTTTNGLKHEWMIDALDATATGGALEGDQFSASALLSRTRYQNYVQRFRRDFAVSNDIIEASKRNGVVGVRNEMDYQAGKKVKEVTRNIDARLWSTGSAAYGSASGATGTTALMANIRAWASAAGVATNQSGAFSTGILYSLQETMWTAGAKPDTLFVSPGVKVDVSRTLLGDKSFPVTKDGNQGLSLVNESGYVAGGEYGPVIEYIKTDFGRCAVVMDRWIPQSASTGATASETAAWYLIEKAKVRLAYWRPIKPYPVAPQGDFMAAYILGALTLEVLHPTCIGHAWNVTT